MPLGSQLQTEHKSSGWDLTPWINILVKKKQKKHREQEGLIQ